MLLSFSYSLVRVVALGAALTGALATPAIAQAPTWEWGLQTLNPTPTDNSLAMGNAVAVDAAGRVYVGGEYDPFGTSSGTLARSFGSAGSVGPGAGGFVAQATAAGQWAWLTPVTAQPTTLNATPDADVTGVAAVPSGGVYLSGFARGSSVQVGGQRQPISGSEGALFVARLDATGACQWLNVVPAGLDRPALAYDPGTGGAVLAGTFTDQLTLGTTTLRNTGGANTQALYVARLSATGQWLAAVSPTSQANLLFDPALTVGPAGQVAVVGAFAGSRISFGGTAFTRPNAVAPTLLVAQLSPANTWDWAWLGPDGGTSYGFGAGYTPGGALWVSGRGSDGAQVGPATLLAPAGSAASSSIGFVGQLSSTGQWNLVETLTTDAAGQAVFATLSADAAGNAVVLGGLRGTAGPVQASLGANTLAVANNQILYFTGSLSSSGQWHHVATVPPTGEMLGLAPTSVALDDRANLYLTGRLRGSLTLGSSVLAGSSGSNTTSNSIGDVVLGKLRNATALPTRAAQAAPTLVCWPRPAHGAATLRLPTAATEDRSAVLLDALGRPARGFLVPAHTSMVALDLRNLAPGIYLLRCGVASVRLVIE